MSETIEDKVDRLQADMKRLLKAVTNLTDMVDAMRTADHRFWRLKDMAYYVGFSSDYYKRQFFSDKKHPAPVHMPSGGERWIAEEIRQYHKKHPKGWIKGKRKPPPRPSGTQKPTSDNHGLEPDSHD